MPNQYSLVKSICSNYSTRMRKNLEADGIGTTAEKAPFTSEICASRSSWYGPATKLEPSTTTRVCSTYTPKASSIWLLTLRIELIIATMGLYENLVTIIIG